MKPLEENALRGLLSCAFPSRTWHAQFVRRLWAWFLRDARLVLTQHEARTLWALCWRYRGQLGEQVNMAAVLAEAQIRHQAERGTPLLNFPPSEHRSIGPS